MHFDHVAPLENCVPANSALRLIVDHHEGWKPDPSWMRRPGRPQRTWLHRIQQDSGVPPSTASDSEVARGHGAEQQSQTMRQ